MKIIVQCCWHDTKENRSNRRKTYPGATSPTDRLTPGQARDRNRASAARGGQLTKIQSVPRRELKCSSVRKTKRRMLYREVIFFCCCKNETEYIDTTCRQNTRFLGAFAELRNASIGFVTSVSLSVRLSIHVERLGYHWTDFHENLYFNIFENPSRKSKFN
jgi:hypothetical protein